MKAYIGTYAKYNNGSLAGAWVELADFYDVEDFYEYCASLHADEADPEFMVQDWEDAPAHFSRSESVSQAAINFARLDEAEREVLAAYIDICGASNDATIEQATDYLIGRYDSEHEAAESLVGNAIENDGLELPHWLVTDFQATWRCSLRHDYSSGESGGSFWVFSN